MWKQELEGVETRKAAIALIFITFSLESAVLSYLFRLLNGFFFYLPTFPSVLTQSVTNMLDLGFDATNNEHLVGDNTFS